MKKVAALAVIVGALWAVTALTVRGMGKVASLRDWPMGLGRLEDVHQRFPPLETNAAAEKLEELAEAKDVAAIRRHLLTAPPLVWECDIEHGSRSAWATITDGVRLLGAELKRSGDWEDARAAWVLAKSLWARPETSAVAHGLTRTIVDAARSNPSPAPPWFEEVRGFGYRRAAIASMQADTWRFASSMESYAAHQRLVGPYWRLARADYVRWRREAAWRLSRDEPAGEPAAWNRPALMATPDLNAEWKQVVDLERDAKAVKR